MTREQAIHYLQSSGFSGKQIDTIEQALSRESCEDAISRKAMLEYQQYLHGKMSNEENHKMWEFIKSLPSVTPMQPWIPISEELPRDNEMVIASVGEDVYPEARYSKEDGWEFASDLSYDYWEELKGVDAWMPIPKAYKSEPMTIKEAIEILRCKKDGNAVNALEMVLRVAEEKTRTEEKE